MVLQLVLLVLLTQAKGEAAMAAGHATQDVNATKSPETRQEVLNAIQRAPENADLWIKLGEIDASRNSLDASIADFRKAVALAPSNPAAYFGLGSTYGRKGDTDNAREMYRQGLALNPEDPRANRNYAALLMKAGMFREALEPLKRLASLDPQDTSVHVALIEGYLKSGMREEGERETRDFLSLPSFSIRDKLILARTLYKDREATAADFVLANLLATSPQSAEAYGEVGLLQLERNQFEEAVLGLGRAAQLDPASAKYSLGLGRALLRWQNYPTALDFLNAVKDRFSGLPDYQYELAWAYYGIRDYPKSISLLQALAERRAKADLVLYSLGNCYSMQGDLRGAEEHYRQAIKLNPHEASYYIALAPVLRKQQKMEEALACLRQALKLSAGNPQARLELALWDEAKGEYTQAQSELEDVVQNEPNLLAAHRVLARVYYRKGKKAEGDREAAIVSKLDLAERKKGERLLELPFGLGSNEGSGQQTEEPE
ncbi:MAG: tetratricopeptide repeat protein [Terriglobia bacterium]|jgi:Flp pilus assembly protein TadD